MAVSGANWPRREGGLTSGWSSGSQSKAVCSEREVVSGVGEKLVVLVVLVVHRRMEWSVGGGGMTDAGRKRAIFRSAAFLSQDAANQRRRAWMNTATHAGIVMR